MPPKVIRLHPSDNVIIALADLPSGTQLPELAVPLVDAIPRGHKIATRAISKGETVLRYGQIIGQAIMKAAKITPEQLKSAPKSQSQFQPFLR